MSRARLANETEKWVGRSIPVKESLPLVTGSGCYVADIRLPGMLDIAFVRSDLAHAEIGRVDVSEALRRAGVIAAICGHDIESTVAPFRRFVDQEHTPPGLKARVDPEIFACDMPVLPTHKVHYVGQAIACVVAQNRYIAEDAAERIAVEYTELAPVIDPEAARAPGSSILHASLPGNLQARFNVSVGDVDSRLQEAAHRLDLRFTAQRLAGSPIETRGVVASYEISTDELTVWSSTQTPHMVRSRISEQLGLAEDRVRVIAPQVGGGFGPKAHVYPEEIIVAHLARTLRRPVRWIEDRREHLLSTTQSRDQIHSIEVGFDNEGVITALRDHFIVDCGAFNPFSITAAFNTAAHLRSIFRIPNYAVDCECVVTNKTPNTPYRGAGRPEGSFVMDRIMYQVARSLELDPADVLRRNMIEPWEMPYARGMPYRDGEEIIYDRADYPAAFEQLVEEIGYAEHRKSRHAGLAPPTWRGIGFGSYVEGTGIGPFESASVALNSKGQVVVRSGSAPHGQSHDTTISQIVSDVLDIRPQDVVFRSGDTALLPYGCGTFGSRSLINAGSAAHIAAENLRLRILAIAANLLNSPVDQLVIADRRVFSKMDRGVAVTFEQVFRAAGPGPESMVPKGADPGIDERHYFVPPTVTWGSGVVAATVVIDPDTGRIGLEKLMIVHDCGRIVHPLVVEGQIDGAVAQGVGMALYEQVVYDDHGQPLTTTLMDYMLPTAAEIPPIIQRHHEFVSDRNPLGVKGVGEAGVIAVPSAIANAVADALAPLQAEIASLPVRPEQVLVWIGNSDQRTVSGLV